MFVCSYLLECVFAWIEKSPQIYAFVDPQSPAMTAGSPYINSHQLLKPNTVCVGVCVPLVVSFSLCEHVCAYVYVKACQRVDVRAFCAVMPACLTSLVLFRIHIQHFVPTPPPSPLLLFWLHSPFFLF